jgi:hypothetical protein
MSLTASSETVARSVTGLYLTRHDEGMGGTTHHVEHVARDHCAELVYAAEFGEISDDAGRVHRLTKAEASVVAAWALVFTDRR